MDAAKTTASRIVHVDEVTCYWRLYAGVEHGLAVDEVTRRS